MSSVPDLLQPIDENSQQEEENHPVVPNAVSTSKKIKRKKINIKERLRSSFFGQTEKNQCG